MTSQSTAIEFSDLKKVSLIGEGNSRTPVYTIIHCPTGKFYALKQLGTSDSLSDNWHQEIEILKDLNHPNIIKCYQVFEKDAEVAVLLEHMADCKSLDGTHISNEIDLADVTSQVLLSLDYLHKRGLFHGNIRPSKIFMGSEKNVKVAYLGGVLKSDYGSSSKIGYQSRECLKEVALDKETMFKADIWSLGLSILELFLGFFPYGRNLESVQILFKIWNDNPPRAPKAASPDFRDFISCCLQTNPTTRWSTEQLLGHPFVLQKNKSEMKSQLPSPLAPQASASFSSPPSTTWSANANKLFERGLVLFDKHCPDRWDKLAAFIGHGISAEDVKNPYEMLSEDVKAVEGYVKLPIVKQSMKPKVSNLPPRRGRIKAMIFEGLVQQPMQLYRGSIIENIFESLEHYSKPFQKSNAQNRMEKTEVEEEKYSSKHVPRASSEFENLSEHVKTEVEEENYSSKHVPRASSEFENLSEHVKTEVEEEKYSSKHVPRANSEFENLSEHVKRCLVYCSLFPLDYEFEKPTLVQLWIAEELIGAKGKDRMEKEGSACFDILACKEYIVPSRFDNLYGQMKYKVNESKASSWYLQRGSSEDSYLRIEESKLDNNFEMALHISWHSNKFDQSDFEALRSCKRLRTLMLLGDYGSSIKRIPDQFFLYAKSLRTLDLSQTHISGLPSSVGCLELLHYLELSYTPILVLPESIDHLYGLQTLKLRGCLALRALPKGMRKLINLRHLDFDIVRQLHSMPKGMGCLTNLQTLKAFLVGKDDGCRISELKNVDNITGSFCISRLENIPDAEEAKRAALSNKQYITKLELRWVADRNDNSLAEAEILECLQPHFSLKELEILFYNGSSLPSWITNPSFTDLISISLYKCKNCYYLPSLGELPSLRFLKVVEMNKMRNINHLFCGYSGTKGSNFFPKLEILTLDTMLNLEEWTGVEENDFPCLVQMFIQYCPKFHDLPVLSHFKSLKYLEISHSPVLPYLPEDGLPASLETLIIRDCPKVKERCCKEQGKDWLKIAQVPSIWIDDEQISSAVVEKRKEVEDLSHSHQENKEEKLRRAKSL